MKLPDPEELQKGEWTPEGTNTTFYFAKLPSFDGWRVLERLRRGIGETRQGLDIDEKADPGAMILDLLGALPEAFVDQIRTRMFEAVEFKNDNTGRTGLKDNEETAGMELDPFDWYWVLARSLVVNFSASFGKLRGNVSLVPRITPGRDPDDPPVPSRADGGGAGIA